MKIVGICGSPRKGNTEWMLGTLMNAAAESGAEVETLLLRRMNIRMCLGCLSCAVGGKDRKGDCKIKDDMTEVLPKLLEADVIVLATPTYFSLLSGLLKNFMDRTTPIWPKLEGKKIAGLAVAGEGIGAALNNLKTYGAICGMRWVGGVTTLAEKPGKAAKNKGLENKLIRLAKKLITN
jgi:multimeric flavodoxin WrbA